MTINEARFVFKIFDSELINILYIASGKFHNAFNNEDINTLFISKSSKEEIKKFFFSISSLKFHIFVISSFTLEIASSLSFMTIITKYK